MSSDKPRSVREFLMNVPPPSKCVQDDRILEEMNKLHRQKLVQKAPAPAQAQPKPTTAQIIRRNSLKESEKRKLTSENGPLSEIDPESDRFAARVKKFKKPSGRSSTASPVSLVSSPSPASSTSAPNSTFSSLKAASNEPSKATQPLTQSSDPKKSPEKPKMTPIDDILESIFQSAEKAKPSSQSVTPPLSDSKSTKPVSPRSTVNHPPKPSSPSQNVSIPSKAIPSLQSASNTLVPSTAQQPSAPALNSVSSATNALPPHHFNPTNAIHPARPVAPWASVKPLPIHSQASVAASSQTLPAVSAPLLPSPPLSAQQSSNSPVLLSLAAGQSPHSQDNPKKLSKNQQKKLRQAAKKAAKEHADNFTYKTNTIEDTDFDTLLQLHEKSVNPKPSDQPINKNAKQNKNKKNKKNKAPNTQISSNTSQHNQSQTVQNSNAVNNQAGAIHQVGGGQLINQAAYQQTSPASVLNNNEKPSLEDVARQIIGAPKPMKRPNDNKASQQNKRQKTKKEFVPLITCRFFANGHCSNGDACTFKHDKDAVVVRDNPKKKIVCEFFKTGSCFKLDACPFSHDLKLEPCRFFHLNNNCKEANCPYSHDPLNDDMLTKLHKLTGPCRYYHFKGVCNQGDHCPFSHDDVGKAELEKVEASIHLCTFYHLEGACAKGDDCFYLHQEATAEQIAELKAKNKK
ncbi:hypothetical protein MBANPS3_006956 [Mucor bainieri]